MNHLNRESEFFKEDIRSGYDLVKIKYRDIRPHGVLSGSGRLSVFAGKARREINQLSANSGDNFSDRQIEVWDLFGVCKI